ncbi:iron-containing alcohol dehydrogenase [Pelosinus sp. sgz500959]|uniref:iron-containing alcohol dehydrogenase n=1 Tax=Pelosinus sp. sgz500959 TaxID=3242472 RepID=UPI00366EE3A1
MHFSYFMPTKIIFGWGKFEQASSHIVKFGQKILLVTGKYAMKKQGFTDRLIADLQKQGAETALFAGMSANPLTKEVNACVDQFADWQPDVVVALGGGSVIDGAKGIILGLSTREKVEPYLLGQKPITHVDVPLIAIPTTAGTGSETNWAAILTDESCGVKTSFRHEGLFPQIAIVDPQLTVSLTSAITLETGFDVFAHAVETYISKSGLSPQIEMNSLAAIQLVGEYLPQALLDGNNQIARTKMMYGSMLMGFNLANSSTCLPHRLQYPIGVKTNTSHGSGLMVLFESWLEQTYEFSQEKFDRIASALDGKPSSCKEEFMSAYRNFIRSLGVNLCLTDFSLTKQDIGYLAERVTGSLANDPAGQVPGIVEKIYNGAFTK